MALRPTKSHKLSSSYSLIIKFVLTDITCEAVDCVRLG
jgi:hypothetical protein